MLEHSSKELIIIVIIVVIIVIIIIGIEKRRGAETSLGAIENGEGS